MISQISEWERKFDVTNNNFIMEKHKIEELKEHNVYLTTEVSKLRNGSITSLYHAWSWLIERFLLQLTRKNKDIEGLQAEIKALKDSIAKIAVHKFG